MIAANRSVVSLAIRTAMKAKTFVQRRSRALMDAKVHRIEHDIEFHRRLEHYRRTSGMPPLQ